MVTDKLCGIAIFIPFCTHAQTEWYGTASVMLQWKWVCGSLLSVAVLVFWLASREHETSKIRWTVSIFLPLLISGYGLKKHSLDSSGAALAVVVGFLLTSASACFSACLIVFFITSSRLTKWKAAEKRKLEEEYKEGTVYTLFFLPSSLYQDCLFSSPPSLLRWSEELDPGDM